MQQEGRCSEACEALRLEDAQLTQRKALLDELAQADEERRAGVREAMDELGLRNGEPLFLDERQYEPTDEIDQISSRPDFAMLIYSGGLVDKGKSVLRSHIRVSGNAPPMFFAHAFDDRVSVHNTLALATALKEAGGSAEAHIYESGGHGYGLRRTDAPVTSWPDRARNWMNRKGFLASPESSSTDR